MLLLYERLYGMLERMFGCCEQVCKARVESMVGL
jgi:hypothetical protein